MFWTARLFDHRTTQAREVIVSIADNLLCLQPRSSDPQNCVSIRVALAATDIEEHFANAPRFLEVPGHGVLQIEDPSGTFNEALCARGYTGGLVQRLASSFYGSAVCVTMLALLVIWWNLQGIDLVAGAATRWAPRSLVVHLDRASLTSLDSVAFAPSTFSSTRKAAIQARFLGLVHAQYRNLPCSLQFRGTRAGVSGLNALALPGGTIVVLDGLASRLTDDELLAVLGHELGHIVYRHPLHMMIRRMGLFAIANVLWGDASGSLASTVTSLEENPFDRQFESDADAFAVRFLVRAGVPADSMIHALQAVATAVRDDGEPPTFLNDHPALGDRIKAVEALTREGAINSRP
jgi:Zn-dependent protease with chaperone function